ncbi:MAG: hypothetical protein ACOC9B_04115 [Chloroflexota bacterium]
MVDEIEKGPAGQHVPAHLDTATLQKKVKDGLVAERRLDDGSVAPWEIERLRRLATEGRKAQTALRRGGHEPSLPEESMTDD